MYKSLFASSIFHTAVIVFSIFTLPFIAKQPLDIPPLVSVELIQISDKTNIPFAPKAKKIIEKVKKDNERLVSEQAPPKKLKKTKKKKLVSENNKKNNGTSVKENTYSRNKKRNTQKRKLDAIPLPDKKMKNFLLKKKKNKNLQKN